MMRCMQQTVLRLELTLVRLELCNNLLAPQAFSCQVLTG